MEDSQREFVSNVSHELRNPLAAIKAMVETLEDGALLQPDVAPDFLKRILGEIDRMTALGNDLLELSRLESGQRLLDLAPVDLGPMAQEVQLLFRDAARQGRRGRSGCGRRAVPRLGGRSSLQQALVNLVENAVNFTNNGDRIALSVEVDGPCVALEVRDTGPGIPQRDIPLIFERFYKADRRRQDSGAGLGLAIVKRIVTAHGGDLQVESREGEGSVFRALIP